MSFRGRRRFNASIRPVNRIKHVVDQQGGIVLNTKTTVDLISTFDAPVLAGPADVETGSKVNGIYLKVEVYATTEAALANCYMYVMKNPGNQLTGIPNPNTVGVSNQKKYVIHQEMVMLEQSINGNPRTLFNGVIAIPKGYRRNGPKDKLILVLLAPGVDIFFCMQCHYKEFR